MRIKMITMSASPDGNLYPGQEYTVSEKLGNTLISSKAAVKIERLECASRLPEPEAAIKPKHIGGGWYQLADGRRVRKSELESR